MRVTIVNLQGSRITSKTTSGFACESFKTELTEVGKDPFSKQHHSMDWVLDSNGKGTVSSRKVKRQEPRGTTGE